MTGKELYPLVFQIVKRAQKENPKLKSYTIYYGWSTRIPEPSKVSEDLASALCTSISHSANYGLEIYFQERVYENDLLITKTVDSIKYLLENLDENGNKYQTLGFIVRKVFSGRMVLDSEDLKLLSSI
jgi:hypothetical protein